MKVIGHRGAAGLALGNSHESIAAALKYNLDAIEFDVRMTKDGEIVVIHDFTTARVADKKVNVKSQTLKELKLINLKNKQKIPTLVEVLNLIKSHTVIIDIKDNDIADKLPELINKYPKINFIFASFKHDELRKIKKLLPDAHILVSEHFNPIEIIFNAKRLNANGITLNKWLLNPITYNLAERYNLSIYVYTVNNHRLAKFIDKLYPGVAILTDRPHKLSTKKTAAR